MQYLTAEDILEIHSILIDEIGGLHGLRDRHALLSVVGQPQQTFGGKELYETVFDKASVYAGLIIKNHPFVDGNKRTAMTATGVFLELNGYQLRAPERAVEKFALKIAGEDFELGKVSSWLKKHTEKIKSKRG